MGQLLFGQTGPPPPRKSGRGSRPSRSFLAGRGDFDDEKIARQSIARICRSEPDDRFQKNRSDAQIEPASTKSAWRSISSRKTTHSKPQKKPFPSSPTIRSSSNGLRPAASPASPINNLAATPPGSSKNLEAARDNAFRLSLLDALGKIADSTTIKEILLASVHFRPNEQTPHRGDHRPNGIENRPSSS